MQGPATSGSKTFAPHLASVILSRRKSIDGADIMKSRTQHSAPVADPSQLMGSTPRLVRARSLPNISSWGMSSFPFFFLFSLSNTHILIWCIDIYGDDSIVVEFDARRSSISSYTNLADHLRMLGVYDSPVAKCMLLLSIFFSSPVTLNIASKFIVP